VKIESFNTNLLVSDIPELSATAATELRDDVRAALEPSHQTLEVNLSRTVFVDSSGLGVLIALHKLMSQRGGRLHLVNPSHGVQQVLELTRLHQVLEIVKKG